MGPLWRKVFWLAVVGACLSAQTGPGFAQAAKKAAPKAKSADEAGGGSKKDPASAQKAFDAGVKAFEAGKHDQAVASLSAAIASGGLPSQNMARALYYRGASYRKQGKPAQAISDLTSALWLKGGLSDAERAAAMENRAGAYREAGLVEQSQVETARNSAVEGRPVAVTEKAPPRAAPGTPQAAPASVAAPQATSTSGWQTATAVRPNTAAPATTSAVQVQPAASTPANHVSAVQRPASTAVANAAAFGQPPPPPMQASVRERVATAPSGAEQPASAPAPQQSSSGGILKGLFGDLSLGGSAPPPPARPAPAQTAQASTATSDWSQSTRVAAPGAKQQVAAAPVPAAAPPQQEGQYRLQVAAVRTRQEADQVAARLRQQHAKELKARGVEIDEATLANIGTFYRVRVGPYVEANEPRNLCVKLRQKGYDCLVVTVSQ